MKPKNSRSNRTTRNSYSLSAKEIKEFPLSVAHCLEDILEDDYPTLPSSPSTPNFSQFSTLCKSKSGSKRTQKLIAKSRPEEIQQIIQSLGTKITSLMKDMYGNYMCQTLFQSCSSEQRVFLLQSIKKHLYEIARNQKGTHSLQTLISLSSLPEEEAIYFEVFRGKILELALHSNGSHVVQRLLLALKNKNFVLEELKGHIKMLSMNKYGLSVVKKCITEKMTLKELMKDPLILMQDPYGNYAMQLTVDYWQSACTESMVHHLTTKVAQLSIQKYASNVIEKCLKEPQMRSMILGELIKEEKLSLLLNSTYGCYVLRTAAQEVDESYKSTLKQEIVKSSPSILAKKVNSKWEDILKNLN